MIAGVILPTEANFSLLMLMKVVKCERKNAEVNWLYPQRWHTRLKIGVQEEKISASF